MITLTGSPNLITDERHHRGASVDLRLLTRSKPLPVLPDGAPLLLDALSDPTLPFEKLADIVGTFPSIVARLLSLANSPWSSPATPVTNLESAVARLGLNTVRSVSIALTISAPFNPIRCAAFNARRYWCSALLAADTAARFATLTGSTIDISSPTARAAGLMHNLGLLWMADTLPRETDHALSVAAENPTISVSEALISNFGVGYGEAGAALSEAWNIPQPIATGMAYHLPAPAGTREERLAGLIKLVAAMISTFHNGAATGVDPALYEDLNIDSNIYVLASDHLDRTFPEIQDLADILFHRKNLTIKQPVKYGSIDDCVPARLGADGHDSGKVRG